MRELKQAILRFVLKLGYKVTKVKDPHEQETYKRSYSHESLKNKRFYNIGAGTFYHPYWTNIDFYSDWYKKDAKISLSGIHFDLMSMKKLPIEDNSAEAVYSSHTLEHITNEAAQNILNESYRILKDKGILRITTPNIDFEYRAYLNNDPDYSFWKHNFSSEYEMKRIKINKPMNQASTEQIFLYHFAANVSTLHADGAEKRITDEEFRTIIAEKPMEEALDYCVSKCDLKIHAKYPGNHINWWNSKKLTRMLENAGFKEIYLSGYGQSFSPAMRNTYLFDSTHPKMSLYMEAIK